MYFKYSLIQYHKYILYFVLFVLYFLMSNTQAPTKWTLIIKHGFYLTNWKNFIATFNRYCIPNAVEDTTNDRVLRLNINAHPLSYVNDQDMGTTWLSKIMTTQELDDGVTITVDFVNGQYQVRHLMSYTYPMEL